MKNISNLKAQISLLYVCAWLQFGLMTLALMADIPMPKLFWVSSLVVNALAIVLARPFKIMDALIDGYSAECAIKHIANNRGNNNGSI